MGIELSVLGTSNPIAAKLYSKYGFGYCFGSGIMMRFKSGHLVDYNKKYLDDSAIEIKVEEGTPSARIPIVPLSIYKTNFLINDINIALFNSDVFTQPSCMGLFPRYLSVIDKGGSFYIAKESAGAIGAVLSVIPDDCGEYRADFFFAEGFKKSINEMIELAKKKHGRIYFEVAKKDVYKMEILKSNGFNKTINSVFEHNGFKISTLKFYE